jgi:hypothetical protein
MFSKDTFTLAAPTSTAANRTPGNSRSAPSFAFFHLSQEMSGTENT